MSVKGSGVYQVADTPGPPVSYTQGVRTESKRQDMNEVFHLVTPTVMVRVTCPLFVSESHHIHERIPEYRHSLTRS